MTPALPSLFRCFVTAVSAPGRAERRCHQVGFGPVCLDLAATLTNPALALSLPPEHRGPSERAESALLPETVFAGLDLPAWQAALAAPEISPGPGPSSRAQIGLPTFRR